MGGSILASRNYGIAQALGAGYSEIFDWYNFQRFACCFYKLSHLLKRIVGKPETTTKEEIKILNALPEIKDRISDSRVTIGRSQGIEKEFNESQ